MSQHPKRVDGHFPVNKMLHAITKDIGKFLWMDMDKCISCSWKNRSMIAKEKLKNIWMLSPGNEGSRERVSTSLFLAIHSIPRPQHRPGLMDNRKHARQGLRSSSCIQSPGLLFWGRILLKVLWARTRMRNPTVFRCPMSSTEPAPDGNLWRRQDTPWCCRCHRWSTCGPTRSVIPSVIGQCGTWPDFCQPDLSSLL